MPKKNNEKIQTSKEQHSNSIGFNCAVFKCAVLFITPREYNTVEFLLIYQAHKEQNRMPKLECQFSLCVCVCVRVSNRPP